MSDLDGQCITQDLSGFTGTVAVSATNPDQGIKLYTTVFSSNGVTEPGFSWTVPSGGSDTVCIVSTGPPSSQATVTFTGTSA